MTNAIWHPEYRWGTAPVTAALRHIKGNDKPPAIRELASKKLELLEKTDGKQTIIATSQ